jgi:hypothetical protein
VKRLTASFAALAVVAFSLVSAVPASAHAGHWITTPEPADFFAKAMYADLHTVTCLGLDQGTWAVVHFKNSANGPVHHTEIVSSEGCTWEYHPLAYVFRICHNVVGCSAWHRTE